MSETPQHVPIEAAGVVDPFPSISSLRAAHGRLLRSYADTGETQELLDEAEVFIGRGQATGALLDTENDRWASQGLLDFWVAVLYRAGREPPDATIADFDPGLAPELKDAACPYVGLDAFSEAKHDFFFGRQRVVEGLIGWLKDGRLLAVVGPSGSGKSSLVLAGLLPALRAGVVPGSENWRYYPAIVPGSRPLANLARLFSQADADAAGWVQRQVARLQEDASHLAHLVDQRDDRPAVLVIDQFEEVFTLCDDVPVRQAFTNNILGLIRSVRGKHIVILTMRADFEPRVATLPEFHEFFERALMRVPPLSAAELREAIVEPAELVGLKFEDGVIDALLEDILGEPTALPLLQFTLLKLWEKRERNRVTWEAYRRLGGGRQALANVADEFYEGLIHEDRVVVRYIFLRMVRPGEGLEVTSNRIRRKTLYQAGPAPYLVDRVLDKLIDARLVRLTTGDTPDDDQVEVAHEALVRNWPRLGGWLEEEQVTMITRRRLEARAAEWVRFGRASTGLLDEAQLLEAESWLDSPDAKRLGYGEDLPALVQASRAAIVQAIQEREAARKRELDQAHALVQAEQQRATQQAEFARRLRWLVVALAMVGVLALIAAMLAINQGRKASDNAATAVEAQQLAEVAAAEAVTKQKVAQDALATLEAQIIYQLQPTATGTPTVAPTFMPTLTPTSTSAGVASPRPTPRPTITPSPTRNLGATATARALATELSDIRATGTALVVQPLSGDTLTQMTYESSDEYVPSLSPDQRTLLVQSDRTGAWHIFAMDPDGRNWRQLTEDGSANYQARFSPDGTRIVFSSDRSGNQDIYTMATDGSDVRRLTDAAGADSYPSYSRDGNWIVFMSSRGGNNGVYIMRADGSEQHALIDTAYDEVYPSVSPDGQRIVFQSDKTGNWEIYTLSVGDGEPHQLTDNQARDADPIFSPDGHSIVFETNRDGDYEIYVMNSDGSRQRNLTNSPATRDMVPSVSPDGLWVLFQSNRNGNWDVFRIPLSG